MYSKTIIIGPIKSIKILEDGSASLLLTTTRPFPNDEFEYERDFLEVRIWKAYYESMQHKIQEGNLINVEGRLQSEENEISSFKNYLVAEIVTKLPTK